ncbi:hypothetical protein NEDG_00271 [Nematocida displodere]|uniref:Uncharacterized protein n=1 Tax=Nematocida displodere TaxID=1805483 RepID=A0A177EJB1_9MICR|nr:hypothetical protein NEDG_00271 [Nematocida displodere]
MLSSMVASVWVRGTRHADLIYRDAQYTQQTLDFFKVSDCKLQSRNRNGQKYMTADQSMSYCQIDIGRYSLETIPDQMIQGMSFMNLTLENKDPRVDQPLHKKIVEKIFRALGSILTETLVIEGLNISDTAQPMEVDSQIDMGPSAMGINPEADKATTPLKLQVSDLRLQNMGESSIRWVLGHIDVSKCELSLCISDVPTITSLQFLDTFNPLVLCELHIRNAVNLTSIDCMFLKECKVMFCLTLSEMAKPVSASAETLRGIAAKSWEFLAVPAEVWYAVVTETRSVISASWLRLTIDFLHRFDAFWSLKPPAKALVRDQLSLTLRNADADKKTKKEAGLSNIFSWIDRCISPEVESVEIEGLIEQRPKLSSNQAICIEPFLPRLDRIHLKIGDVSIYRVFHTRNILWIAPDAYSAWQQGKLDSEMERVSKDTVVPISSGQTPRPFLSNVAAQNTNPECFMCHKSVSEIAELTGRARPRYVGIVCEMGHILCTTCHESLCWRKDKSHPILCSTHCQPPVLDLDGTGAIERNREGKIEFKLVWRGYDVCG